MILKIETLLDHCHAGWEGKAHLIADQEVFHQIEIANWVDESRWSWVEQYRVG